MVNKNKNSSKYALSSIVYCGECSEIYRRVHWNNRGYKSIVWWCISRLEEHGKDCSSSTITEEALQSSVLWAINQMLCRKDDYITIHKENIETVLNEENDETLEGIDAKLNELQNKLVCLVS